MMIKLPVQGIQEGFEDHLVFWSLAFFGESRKTHSLPVTSLRAKNVGLQLLSHPSQSQVSGP